MTLFHWRDNLNLGVPVIDKDHRRLVDLLNRVHYLALAGDDRRSIAAAIDELADYVERHFRREEMLMRLSGYPGYELHRQLHQRLTTRVAEFQQRFSTDPARFNVDELYEFLADWLMVHIAGEDVKIAPYVARLDAAHAA